jgi:GNAT superfamily N-acetyltransferase
MDLIPLDPKDSDQVDAFARLGSEVSRHDRDAMPECEQVARHLVTSPEAGRSQEIYLAVCEGEPVGGLLLGVSRRENDHLMQMGLLVAPRARRRGVGTALLDHARKRAAHHGCSDLITNATGPLDGRADWSAAAVPFAAANGFTSAQRIVAQRLELVGAEAAADQAWAQAREHFGDYELAGYLGTVPEELAEGVATLMTRINLDVPSGEVPREVAHHDVARLREAEGVEAARGITKIGVAARHRRTGEVAGYTTLLITRSDPDLASVGMTLVAPAHRGNRLGVALKVRIQRDLARDLPGVTGIETGNADVNDHMRGINTRLGFRPIGYVTVYRAQLGGAASSTGRGEGQ